MEDLKIQLNKGKQEQFCSLPDSIFEGFYGGAKGGGKSFSLLVLPLIREFYKIPTFHGIILRRTYPELVKHQIDEAHKIYPYFGAKYNDQKKRYKFPSGAVIDFGSAEYESDIKTYDSGEYQYIAFDELTSFTEFQYRYMLGMCRTSDKRLPHIVRSGSNPGNIGHTWVRDRFVEPYRTGGKIIIDKLSGRKRIFIQAFATDNPKLLEATPDYLEILDLLPEAERLAKKFGDWYTFSGAVFTNFRTVRFDDEPENACHVIDSTIENGGTTKIPSWTKKILTVDWGYEAMTYVTWSSILGKRVTIYREYSCTEMTVEQWATEVAKESLRDENIKDLFIVIDKSAWQNRGTGTIIQQFISAWERVTGNTPIVIPSDSDRISGKQLVHEFLRWAVTAVTERNNGKYDEDMAATILQTQGLEDYKKYLLSFSPIKLEPEILPRLQITSNCKHLIKTIPLCVYEEKGKNGKNPEDVAEFSGDDPYDNLRYLLKAVSNYYNNVNDNKSKFDLERMEICSKVEESKDMTSFYRKMEHLDGNTNKFINPIRLTGRRRSGVHF